MQKFIEIAGRIGAQRHLVAIRDGFVAIMPLIIIGSLAVLFSNFPPLGKFKLVDVLNNIFGEGNWQTVGGSIWSGTFAIIGLLIAFSVAYNLARSYEIDGLSAGLISAASYIILVPVTPDGGLDFAWLGARGLFIALILSLLVTELFRVLLQTRLTIKMPEGVPDGVARSFTALIPGMIILFLIGLFQAFMAVFAETSIFEIIFNAIQEPLQGLGNTLPAALIIAFLTHLLWFFGLHGSNIIGAVIEPLYLPLLEKNSSLFKGGMSAFDVPYIVTKPFLDTFVYMGGAGTTIALFIAIFIVIRKAQKHPYREITKLAAPAGLFNINEPVIFGLPIVLNPAILIPFIFVPVILTLISYFALAIGLVPRTVAMVPWSTPPILSGYLVTGGSWRGIVLQIFNLAVATIIYIPFVAIGARTFNLKTSSSKENVMVGDNPKDI